MPRPSFIRPSSGRSRDVYDWLTLGTAIAGVVVVVASTIYTARSVEIALNQIDVMRAQSRPWVTANLSNPSGVAAHVANGEFTVYIDSELQNVGQMVATDVDASYQAIVGVKTRAQARQILEERYPVLCARAANSVDKAGVFPGQRHLDRLAVFSSLKDVAPGALFDVYIAGCVSYKSYGAQRSHRTPVLFRVTRSVTDVQRRPGVEIRTTTSNQGFRNRNGERTSTSRVEMTREYLGDFSPN